ncbi:hypothetical protein GCM10027347_61620 [Larkinella harenae]
MDQENKVEDTHALNVEKFRLRTLWRFDAIQDLVKRGEAVDHDDIVLAHSLDSIDLFLRGYLVGKQQNLRFVNSHIRQYKELARTINKDEQSMYEAVFWLVVEAYEDMLEFELYELVPTLKNALEKVTANLFPSAYPLLFPEDPDATEEERLLIAYRMELSPEEAPTIDHPTDTILKLWPPDAHVVQGKKQGLTGESLRLCYFMDKACVTFRRYLLSTRSTLRGFYATVEDMRSQFPDIDPPSLRTLLSAIIDQDLRNHIARFEVWEVMARFDDGWSKIKRKYQIQ